MGEPVTQVRNLRWGTVGGAAGQPAACLGRLSRSLCTSPAVNSMILQHKGSVRGQGFSCLLSICPLLRSIMHQTPGAPAWCREAGPVRGGLGQVSTEVWRDVVVWEGVDWSWGSLPGEETSELSLISQRKARAQWEKGPALPFLCRDPPAASCPLMSKPTWHPGRACPASSPAAQLLSAPPSAPNSQLRQFLERAGPPPLPGPLFSRPNVGEAALEKCGRYRTAASA